MATSCLKSCMVKTSLDHKAKLTPSSHKDTESRLSYKKDLKQRPPSISPNTRPSLPGRQMKTAISLHSKKPENDSNGALNPRKSSKREMLKSTSSSWRRPTSFKSLRPWRTLRRRYGLKTYSKNKWSKTTWRGKRVKTGGEKDQRWRSDHRKLKILCLWLWSTSNETSSKWGITSVSRSTLTGHQSLWTTKNKFKWSRRTLTKPLK